MTTLRPGDVVLIPAPFADLAATVTAEEVAVVYGVTAKTVRKWDRAEERR